MGAASKRPRTGLRLIKALSDIRDTLKSGEPVEKKYTVRTVILDLQPQEYDAEKVRETRASLGVSQALFAQIIGAKVATVESWEQGVRDPHPMARRLLDEIRRDVEHWRTLIKRSATSFETATSAGR